MRHFVEKTHLRLSNEEQILFTLLLTPRGKVLHAGLNVRGHEVHLKLYYEDYREVEAEERVHFMLYFGEYISELPSKAEHVVTGMYRAFPDSPEEAFHIYKLAESEIPRYLES